MSTPQETKQIAKRSREMARDPKPAVNAELGPKAQTKTALLLGLLSRGKGATLDQLVVGTGWLPHTVRAALTGLKKKGHEITSDKPAGGVRTYRTTAGAESAQ